ncbi:MAG: hypothetical protein S4CHLAM102_05900 [Chlamydiia bacterium]|nr:hypothetical protein [Chlamydiia bacterium]
MPQFISVFPHENPYTHLPDAEKFFSKGRIVTEEGAPITADYEGNRYLLVAKKEEMTPEGKRITRIAHPIFGPHPPADLPQVTTVDIPPDLVEFVNQHTDALLGGEPLDGVEYFQSRYDSRVFTKSDWPDIICKFSPKSKERYKSICRSRAVCQSLSLHHLVVPLATLVPINLPFPLLVEERLNISRGERAQERDYTIYKDDLHEPIRQLAHFIIETGFSDVTWRNVPVIVPPTPEGSIGLVDLEEFAEPLTGLFGGFHRRGLVCCIGLDQIPIVTKVCQQRDLQFNHLPRIIEQRKKELAAQ